MSELAFLSPAEPELRVVEVRGDPGPHAPGLLRLTPERGLLIGSAVSASALRAAGVRAYDVSAAYAAVEVAGEQALRRLTALDPTALPVVGAVARGVAAVVERTGDDAFRLLVPQELGLYVAEVVRDTVEGLAP